MEISRSGPAALIILVLLSSEIFSPSGFIMKTLKQGFFFSFRKTSRAIFLLKSYSALFLALRVPVSPGEWPISIATLNFFAARPCSKRARKPTSTRAAAICRIMFRFGIPAGNPLRLNGELIKKEPAEAGGHSRKNSQVNISFLLLNSKGNGMEEIDGKQQFSLSPLRPEYVNEMSIILCSMDPWL